jgi:hypothetical protein
MTRIIDGQYVDFDHVSDVVAELKRLEPLVGELMDDQELNQMVHRKNPGRYDELTVEDLTQIIADIIVEKTGF